MVKIIATLLPILGIISGNTIPDPRIVGGSDVDINDRPYQMVMYIKSDSKTSLCSASLITNQVAITAAHCIPPELPATSLEIRAGSSSRLEGGQMTNISSYESHPDFNRTTLENDVAVIFLNEPIDEKFGVPIRVADNTTNLAVGTIGIVAGWGRTNESIPMLPTLLKKVEVEVVEKSRCLAIYWTYTNSMICATGRHEEEGPCKGDSGSPLEINHTLIGTLSGSFQCAAPDYPVIFTNLKVLGGWVKEVLRKRGIELN